MQVKLNELGFGGKNFGFFDETAVTTLYGADCNNCINNGIYFLPPNTDNAITSQRCVMLVFEIVYSPTTSTIHQIFFNPVTSVIYHRVKMYDSNAWVLYSVDETSVS